MNRSFCFFIHLSSLVKRLLFHRRPPLLSALRIAIFRRDLRRKFKKTRNSAFYVCYILRGRVLDTFTKIMQTLLTFVLCGAIIYMCAEYFRAFTHIFTSKYIYHSNVFKQKTLYRKVKVSGFSMIQKDKTKFERKETHVKSEAH